MIQTSGIKNEFEVYDERFLYLILGNAWVEKLYTGTLWAEGPVYFAMVITWSGAIFRTIECCGGRAGM